MSILQATSSITGLSGVIPNLVFINTNDTLATVTTAGYLSKAVQDFLLTVSNSTIALVNTSDEGTTWLAVSITGTAPNLVYSLVTTPSSGGTFGGDVQAGASGTAGTFISFPATGSKGKLVIAATANSGNTTNTITNASQAAARTFTIPDPGASANFVMAPAALVSGNVVKASGTAGAIIDAGFTLKANTTAAYAGGGTSNAYTATGVASTSIVTASILASTNAVSITKVVPTANTLTVSFSADPGAATTVSWIAITPAV